MTPFDYIRLLTSSKPDWDSFSDEEKKAWNTYFINRTLSMNPNYLELVNLIQKYWTLEPKIIYNLYKKFVIKGDRINFIKKEGKEFNKELTLVLSDYFKCSTREIKEYLQILSKEQVNEILEVLGHEKKEITKLWK